MSEIGGLSGGSSGGIAGQLDVQWIVEQMVYAKKQPIRDLEVYENFYEAKKSALQELNTKVAAVESALYNINSTGFESKSVTLSSEDNFAATAASTAAEGTYSIIVDQLATAQSYSSGAVADADVTTVLANGDEFELFSDVAQTESLGKITASGNLTLNDLASEINTLGLDVSASVVQYGTGDYRLQITSDETGTDNDFYINSEGPVMTEMVEALDAQLYVNTDPGVGDYISRSSNTITDVIDGVTINLKEKAEVVDIDHAVTLSVASDSADLKDRIQTFVTSFNDAMSYLNEQFTYDEENERAGVLSGETAARSVKADLLSMATARMEGAPDSYNSFSVIGLEINRDGELEINDDKLDEAITDHLDSVQRVFKDEGSANHSEISYIGYGDNTQVGTYTVNITQVAEQALAEGQAAMDTLTADETVTIFHNDNEYTVNLTSGLDADGIVDAINAELDANDASITAQQSGTGVLQLISNDYGTSQTIKLKSDSTGAGTTHIDTTTYDAATTDSGVDVAGTIGGLAASGSGTLLTGTTGDAEGLMISASSTTTGSKGSVSFTKGVGEALRKQMYELSFPYSGTIAQSIDSFDDKLENIHDQISDINRHLATQQEMWITEFTKANEALANLEYLKSTLN